MKGSRKQLPALMEWQISIVVSDLFILVHLIDVHNVQKHQRKVLRSVEPQHGKALQEHVVSKDGPGKDGLVG
jgi:hypothetical protein